MLESLLLHVDRENLTFPFNLNEAVDDDCQAIHQAMVDLEYYKVRIIEYANLKKQMKEKDQALKSVVGQVGCRDEALNEVKADLSSLTQTKDKLASDFDELRANFDGQLA